MVRPPPFPMPGRDGRAVQPPAVDGARRSERGFPLDASERRAAGSRLRRDDVLTDEARAFLAGLHRAFGERRRELLEARRQRQAAFDAGETPSADPATRSLREGGWRVASPPDELSDRRVEIISGAGRDGLLAAMRAGAKAVVVDLEDAMPPGWEPILATHAALAGRWNGVLDGEEGLPETLPPMVLRPRAWHREEPRVTVDGEAMSASLVDAGLFVFHTARPALAAGSAPYLSLPKLEGAAEAALWEDVLSHVEGELGLAADAVRAGIVIETLPAAFAVDEMLHALGRRISHLDVGRRGAVRSFVKTLARESRLLPDPDRIVPGMAFLRALSLLVVARAHARGTLALAGASTRCPTDAGDEATTEAAEKLRADAERAAMDGHDGIRVAHPDFVPVAMEVFDRVMPEPNQLGRTRADVEIGAAELFEPHDGRQTVDGVRACLAILLRVARARLDGEAAGVLAGEVLDVPAAEAAHAILAQWTRARARLEDGRTVDAALVEACLSEEAAGAGEDAARLVRSVLAAEGLPPWVEVEEAFAASGPAGHR